MKISELMTTTYTTCRPEDNLDRAAQIMTRRGRRRGTHDEHDIDRRQTGGTTAEILADEALDEIPVRSSWRYASPDGDAEARARDHVGPMVQREQATAVAVAVTHHVYEFLGMENSLRATESFASLRMLRTGWRTVTGPRAERGHGRDGP